MLYFVEARLNLILFSLKGVIYQNVANSGKAI